MTKKPKIAPERAAELKEELRSLAAEKGREFGPADNKREALAARWTMWLQREASAPVAAKYRIEFIWGAPSAAELFAYVLQNYSYVFQMLDQVLILEAQESDKFVVRECIAD